MPAVELFVKWVKRSTPSHLCDRVGLRMDVGRALRRSSQAGRQPAHTGGVDQALNKITLFNAGGLIPLSDPAQNIPSDCFLVAQVQNGHIMRVPPTSPTGFYCPSGGYLRTPEPMVRLKS